MSAMDVVLVSAMDVVPVSAMDVVGSDHHTECYIRGIHVGFCLSCSNWLDHKVGYIYLSFFSIWEFKYKIV